MPGTEALTLYYNIIIINITYKELTVKKEAATALSWYEIQQVFSLPNSLTYESTSFGNSY